MRDTRFGFLFVCLLITAAGCATVPSDPSSPVIKSLAFSDVKTSGAWVNFTFRNTDDDIEKVLVEVTVNGRRPSDADWEFLAGQWGIRPGTKTGKASFRWPVRHSATRCLTVWIQDTKERSSNKLYGCMTN